MVPSHGAVWQQAVARGDDGNDFTPHLPAKAPSVTKGTFGSRRVSSNTASRDRLAPSATALCAAASRARVPIPLGVAHKMETVNTRRG